MCVHVVCECANSDTTQLASFQRFDYYCELKQYRGYCLWKLAKWPLYLTAAFADDKD